MTDKVVGGVQAELKEMELKETPIEELSSAFLSSHGVRLYVKREDLLHPVISGNKWHKLRHNLAKAKRLGAHRILSFGGAYSNHVHALAYACREEGLSCTGVIRGDELAAKPLNPCLRDVSEWGMELDFISRRDYRLKSNVDFIEGLRARHGDFYCVPEGGSNDLGALGCSDFMLALMQQLDAKRVKADVIVSACGTGTTGAGFCHGLLRYRQACRESGLHGLGMNTTLESALIVNDFENVEVNISDLFQGLLQIKPVDSNGDERLAKGAWSALMALSVESLYGAYGKVDSELVCFAEEFEREYGFRLDSVYTLKAVYGLFKRIEKGCYRKGASLVFVHTGGLQGLR